MILHAGEKVHIIHRRLFQGEARRHMVGVVDAYENGMARIVGYVFTVDKSSFSYTKHDDKRTRIVAMSSGDLFVNVLPPEVDIDKVHYEQQSKTTRVTDGSGWHLELSEFAWT